jgi:hypothetical protein
MRHVRRVRRMLPIQQEQDVPLEQTPPRPRRGSNRPAICCTVYVVYWQIRCKSRFSPMTKILWAVGAAFVYKM